LASTLGPSNIEVWIFDCVESWAAINSPEQNPTWTNSSLGWILLQAGCCLNVWIEMAINIAIIYIVFVNMFHRTPCFDNAESSMLSVDQIAPCDEM
jgi:hypothetical protein